MIKISDIQDEMVQRTIARSFWDELDKLAQAAEPAIEEKEAALPGMKATIGAPKTQKGVGRFTRKLPLKQIRRII
jgi:hypothetical protein